MEKIQQNDLINYQNNYFKDIYTDTIFTALELSKIELLENEAIYIEKAKADYYDYDFIIK